MFVFVCLTDGVEEQSYQCQTNVSRTVAINENIVSNSAVGSDGFTNIFRLLSIQN